MKKRFGFTLSELLIILVVIGVVCLASIPIIRGKLEKVDSISSYAGYTEAIDVASEIIYTTSDVGTGNLCSDLKDSTNVSSSNCSNYNATDNSDFSKLTPNIVFGNGVKIYIQNNSEVGIPEVSPLNSSAVMDNYTIADLGKKFTKLFNRGVVVVNPDAYMTANAAVVTPVIDDDDLEVDDDGYDTSDTCYGTANPPSWGTGCDGTWDGYVCCRTCASGYIQSGTYGYYYSCSNGGANVYSTSASLDGINDCSCPKFARIGACIKCTQNPSITCLKSVCADGYVFNLTTCKCEQLPDVSGCTKTSSDCGTNETLYNSDSSSCYCGCKSGYTKCGGTCTANCGSGKTFDSSCNCVCASSCGTNETQASDCSCSCKSGYTKCNGTCTANCGSGKTFDSSCNCVCASSCGANETQASDCSCSCSSGYTECGGSCVNSSCSTGYTFSTSSCQCEKNCTESCAEGYTLKDVNSVDCYCDKNCQTTCGDGYTLQNPNSTSCSCTCTRTCPADYTLNSSTCQCQCSKTCGTGYTLIPASCTCDKNCKTTCDTGYMLDDPNSSTCACVKDPKYLFGYVVYIDVDGDRGNSELNKDVFKFYLLTNGTAIPAGAAATDKDLLAFDVVYDDFSNPAQGYPEKVLLYNLSFKEAACRSGYVSAQSDFCGNITIHDTCTDANKNCQIRVKRPYKGLK